MHYDRYKSNRSACIKITGKFLKVLDLNLRQLSMYTRIICKILNTKCIKSKQVTSEPSTFNT